MCAVSFFHVPSAEQPAGGLTKPLPAPALSAFCAHMGMRDGLQGDDKTREVEEDDGPADAEAAE